MSPGPFCNPDNMGESRLSTSLPRPGATAISNEPVGPDAESIAKRRWRVIGQCRSMPLQGRDDVSPTGKF
jgi:hypothetical protein